MMQTQGRVSADFIIRNFFKIITSDWPTATNLTGLQLAKKTFNTRMSEQARYGSPDKLRLIHLRITDMCNLRCHTCGQWGDNGYMRDIPTGTGKQREIPLETYKNLVDQTAAAGWSPLWYIWGGEPMLYPGLFDLMKYITARKMPISLNTNGTNVVENIDAIMATCKILFLSIDGPTEEIHNGQRPGASPKANNFQVIETALKTISEEKKRRKSAFPYVVPNTVVSRYNSEYLADIYRFASPFSDAHVFGLSWWIDEPRAQQHTEDFSRRFGFEPRTHLGWIGDWKDFDCDQVFDQFRTMWQLPDSRDKCPVLMFPQLDTPFRLKQYYQDHKETFGFNRCASIHMSLSVNSNGDVSLCQDYPDHVIGNIKNDTLTELWYGEKAREFRRSIASEGLMPVCSRCCKLMEF